MCVSVCGFAYTFMCVRTESMQVVNEYSFKKVLLLILFMSKGTWDKK